MFMNIRYGSSCSKYELIISITTKGPAVKQPDTSERKPSESSLSGGFLTLVNHVTIGDMAFVVGSQLIYV